MVIACLFCLSTDLLQHEIKKQRYNKRDKLRIINIHYHCTTLLLRDERRNGNSLTFEWLSFIYSSIISPSQILFQLCYSRLTFLLEIVPYYSESYFDFYTQFYMSSEFLLLLWTPVAYLEPSQTSIYLPYIENS